MRTDYIYLYWNQNLRAAGPQQLLFAMVFEGDQVRGRWSLGIQCKGCAKKYRYD
jgi:hypothetical protein